MLYSNALYHQTHTPSALGSGADDCLNLCVSLRAVSIQVKEAHFESYSSFQST